MRINEFQFVKKTIKKSKDKLRESLPHPNWPKQFTKPTTIKCQFLIQQIHTNFLFPGSHKPSAFQTPQKSKSLYLITDISDIILIDIGSIAQKNLHNMSMSAFSCQMQWSLKNKNHNKSLVNVMNKTYTLSEGISHCALFISQHGNISSSPHPLFPLSLLFWIWLDIVTSPHFPINRCVPPKIIHSEWPNCQNVSWRSNKRLIIQDEDIHLLRYSEQTNLSEKTS